MPKRCIYIRSDRKEIKIDADTKNTVKKAVMAALAYEGVNDSVEVSVTFTDNNGIQELNRDYRDKDAPTDVLSFPMYDEDDIPDNGMIVLGDIVISLEKAEEQAKEYGCTAEWEIAFLCVHSVLHLLGYDHETSAEDEADMFRRQEEIMDKLYA